MGIRFRKSKNYGPFRVNLSKSGIGYSMGVKGLRVTKKANGGIRTTTSIPGTGISSVSEIPAARSRRKQKNAAKAQRRSMAATRRSIKKEYGLSNRQLKKLEKDARRHPQKYANMTNSQIMASVGGTQRSAPRSSQKRSSGLKERTGHSFWWYVFMLMLVIAIIRVIGEKLFGK